MKLFHNFEFCKNVKIITHIKNKINLRNSFQIIILNKTIYYIINNAF